MNNGIASSSFKRSNNTAKKKGRELFIPAFFVEPPNLDLYAALQNLMWYAVECLNALPSITGRNRIMTDHFFKGVSLLSEREKECSTSLDAQSNKLFVRFLEEARSTEVLLRGFLDPARSQDCEDQDLVPKSAAAAIAAKATYLHWILICLSNELRIPLNPFGPDESGRA